MTSIIGFWEKFNKKWDATNRSTLIVQGDASLVSGISAYKLYVNRNIYGIGARFAHLAPPNSIYARLKAGSYTVVLREYNAMKPDRMESNTLHIKIYNDEQIKIRASLQNGQIILSFDDVV